MSHTYQPYNALPADFTIGPPPTTGVWRTLIANEGLSRWVVETTAYWTVTPTAAWYGVTEFKSAPRADHDTSGDWMSSRDSVAHAPVGRAMSPSDEALSDEATASPSAPAQPEAPKPQ